MHQVPLTKRLLYILAEMGESAVDLAHLISAISSHYGSAYGKGGQGYVAELKRLQKYKDLKILAKQLQYNNYIIAKKVGNRFMVSLTPKGKAATLVARLKSAHSKKDNFYTVVIFDIPVNQNWARRQFRYILKQGNFIMLQRSVWVSQADVYSALVEFVKEVKLDKWINVFRATDFLHMPR